MQPVIQIGFQPSQYILAIGKLRLNLPLPC